MSENISEKKVVVKTQLNGQMMAEFNTISLLRFWWLFVPIGLFLIVVGVALLVFPDGLYDLIIGVFICLFGLFFCFGIFVFPKLLVKTDDKYILPNEITLTFYDTELNVDVSGGEIDEKFITYENRYEILDKAYKFRREYRNENWKYEYIRTCFESKTHFCFRLTFSDIIIFKKSQIVEGDLNQLKELLKEKMGKRFKNKK